VDYDTGTVVSANVACSGTSNRATPAKLVVTVPIEFVQSPFAFHSASLNSVYAGSPPMLHRHGGSGETVFRSLPCLSSPTIVRSRFGPA